MYALNDCLAALKGIDRWGYIGVKRLQLDYRRAFIGSLWVVVAFAATSTSIGFLMASLMGLPPSEHLPYVAFGFAIWNFIAVIISSGCNVFYSNRPMLLQLPAPRSGFVIIHVVRNGALLFVQLFVAICISLFFDWSPNFYSIGVVPALILLIVTAYCATMTVGLISTRFPDFGELMASIMRLAFILTPIMWSFETRYGAASEEPTRGFLYWVYTFNPFTYYVNILREPLLGRAASLLDWMVTGALSVILLIAAFILLQTVGRRLALWV